DVGHHGAGGDAGDVGAVGVAAVPLVDVPDHGHDADGVAAAVTAQRLRRGDVEAVPAPGGRRVHDDELVPVGERGELGAGVQRRSGAGAVVDGQQHRGP